MSQTHSLDVVTGQPTVGETTISSVPLNSYMLEARSAAAAASAASSSSSSSSSSPCYFPNGQKSTNDVPCDPNASVSMCCGDVTLCLSNGLCQVNSGQQAFNGNIAFARGTCTDNQWGSPICPQHCLSSKIFNVSLRK